MILKEIQSKKKNLFIVATDINVKCWANGKAEFLYCSYETTLKDKTTIDFAPFSSALNHSSG